MSELNWARMKVELLRGGVSPKYATRTLDELKAHYSDLKGQAINDGLSESEANERASTSIGDEQLLLREVLNKPELQSLTWRFPKTVFILGPTLVVIASFAILALVLIVFASTRPWFGSMSAGVEIALWEKILLEGLTAFNCYLVTPLLAIVSVILAKRRLINPQWPAVGILVLAILGSGWAYSLAWPSEMIPGLLQINWGYSFLPRAIRGDHDIQNYLQILFTLLTSISFWQIYKPRANKESDSPT